MSVRVYDQVGKEISSGTGFVVSEDGKLVTNYHVIKNAARVSVQSSSGGEFEINGILAEDIANDLVVLKVKGQNLSFLKLDNPVAVDAGTSVVVIGNPLGLSGTVSEGIVSALRNDETFRNRIQITAPISPGSSGSPVLSRDGQVIGVAAFLIKGGQSLNFAIPAQFALNLLREAEARKSKSEQTLPLPAERTAMSRASQEPLEELRTMPEFTEYFAATKAGDFTSALITAKEIMARSPRDPISYYILGSALHSVGFREEGLKVIDDGLRIDPNEPLLWWARGGILLGTRRADASAAYRKAITINPRFRGAWTMLGHSLIGENKGKEAVEAMRSAMQLGDEGASAWTDLGSAYGSAGESTKAISAYKRAIQLDPQSATAWTSLGSEEFKIGHIKEAESSFRKALEVDRNNFPALHGLVHLYWSKGMRAKFDEIAPAYRRVAPQHGQWLDSLSWDGASRPKR